MDKKQAFQILQDHKQSGSSIRNLGDKYGVSATSVHRLLMGEKQKVEKQKQEADEHAILSAYPDDIQHLREELRKARLNIELQDLIIDISGKELGIDLRKKHGTRQS